MTTQFEVVQQVVKTLARIQESHGGLIGTTEKLVERVFDNESRTLSLMHSVLFLKTALCLTWLLPAAFAIWFAT